MHAMNHSLVVHRLAPAFRGLAVAMLLAMPVFAHAQSNADEQARKRLTPEQRRDMLERMPPEQRREVWRQMTPEQRQNIRNQLTPEERQAMRQRFLERQQNRPGVEQGAPPRHQLTPEERQRLRQQIEQAQRDLYKRGNKGAGK